MKISEKIILHKNVYENLSCVVPPYRLTYQEHKELANQSDVKSIYRDDDRFEFISYFYGVELEVVVKI